MEFHCANCDTTTSANIHFDVATFVCPKCQSVYVFVRGELRLDRRFSHEMAHKILPVGQKGTIEGDEYTVSGLLVKKAYGSFYWIEYTLQDAVGKFIYLSESEGHWILLEEVPDKYEVSNHPRFLTHEDIQMNLYHYTNVEIVSAQGFFDFEISKSHIKTTEYINPPYIVSIERCGERESTFFGRHIDAKEIAKGFPTFQIPGKIGNGIVQPFLVDFRNLSIIYCCIVILIAVSHAYIYDDRAQTEVLRENFDLSSAKEFTSQSFELKGGSAPMTVSVTSYVNNSWANVQVGLVNEETNDAEYASKDIEYYHGYTDGESWREGDQSETFNICGVSAGKYHLVITPQKAPEDMENKYMDVTATWNESSNWNVWFSYIFLLITAVILYLLRFNFEKNRWSESDFSPYDE